MLSESFSGHQYNVFKVLEGKFFRGNAFKLKLVEVIDNIPTLSEEFQNALLSAKSKEAVVELIQFGIYRYNKDYSNNYPGTSFNLYKKYTYSKTYPVFINYEKGDDVVATTRYEDRFNDQTTLTAISKSRRTLDSEDVINARNSNSRGIQGLVGVSER